MAKINSIYFIIHYIIFCSGRVSLQTDSTVTKVSWDEDTRIQVEMAGGEVISADYVVLALPLGVLKHSHQHMFSPSLPKEKIEVIEQLALMK